MININAIKHRVIEYAIPYSISKFINHEGSIRNKNDKHDRTTDIIIDARETFF